MRKKSAVREGESHTRTVIKAVSWRILATFTTMTIVFIFTKRMLLSLGVGLIEVIAKVTFYYLHERAWQKISWGKKKHPLSSIPVNRELEPEDIEKVKRQLRDLGYLD